MPGIDPYYDVGGGSPRFLGKFRGIVSDTEDPLSIGRIKVMVPAIPLSDLPNWAMPCVPYAGESQGFYFIPPKGANVWVEFEDGDPHFPIWSGCWWEKKEDLPKKPDEETALPIVKVLQTENFSLVIDDNEDKGSLTLNCNKTAVKNEIELVLDNNGVKLVVKDGDGADKATITMNKDNGIVIDYPNAKITLTDKELKSEVSSSIHTIVDKKITLDTKDVSITGNTTIDKDLTVKGQGDITKDLAVKGKVSVTKDLAVTGKGNITGATTISSNTTITGNLTVS